MKIPGLRLDGLGLELPWRETQVEGVSWIPLFLDSWDEPEGGEGGEGSRERRGGGTVLIRMDPGCGYPAHRHQGGEDVLVLQGSYVDEYGTHQTGEHTVGPQHVGCQGKPVLPGDLDIAALRIGAFRIGRCVHIVSRV